MSSIPDKVKEVVVQHPNYDSEKEDVTLSDLKEYIRRNLDSYDRTPKINDFRIEIISKEENDWFKFNVLVEDSIEISIKRVGNKPPYNWYVN